MLSHTERRHIDLDRYEGQLLSRGAMSVHISGMRLRRAFVLLDVYLTAFQIANTRASGFEELEGLTEALPSHEARVSEP